MGRASALIQDGFARSVDGRSSACHCLSPVALIELKAGETQMWLIRRTMRGSSNAPDKELDERRLITV